MVPYARLLIEPMFSYNHYDEDVEIDTFSDEDENDGSSSNESDNIYGDEQTKDSVIINGAGFNIKLKIDHKKKKPKQSDDDGGDDDDEPEFLS